MEKLKSFLSKSHSSDKIAFYCELISFLFTVIGSSILALTAKDPDMVIIYPIVLLGSIVGVYAYYRRELVWPMMLAIYFVIINSIGLINALT